MKLGSLVAGATMAMMLSATAYAQTPALITGADTSEILNAARGYGSATLVTQSNGDPQINGKINGISYQIYFQNCTDNKDCEDINFYVGFLDLKPGLESINEWNISKRFSRAYLDEDQDACVEMDVDLVKGVTPDYLDSQVELWTMIVEQFADHIGYNG